MPGVAHGQHHVAARLNEAVLTEILSHGHFGTLNRDLAALGHRVFGVDHQVHDDLLQLSGIGARASGIRRESRDQPDVLAN